MKKIPLVIAASLLLIGIGWYLWSKQHTAQPTPQTASINNTTPDVIPAPSTETTNGVISSIKDAMGLGKKMACTYTNPADPSASSTVFIDGQKVKTATIIKGETMYGIFDGDTQYTWSSGKEKQGFRMTKSCMDEIKNSIPQTPVKNTPPNAPVQDYASFDTAQNVSCKAADAEDFSIPADITFVDQCEMFRNSLKGLNQMQQNLPAGVKLPDGVNIPAQH